MRVCLWGTRGSIASAGPETVEYGGNTACAEVEGRDGTIVILDAGTGVRRVGDTYSEPRRLDILLTHLHMDHIQGLGFFGPFFQKDFEIHVWGPPSATLDLRTRLTRYLSPPLFPVRLRDVAARLELHDAPMGELPDRRPARSRRQMVIHPGQTVGYRISDGASTMAYMPDHEPALSTVGHEPDSPIGPPATTWPRTLTCCSTTRSTRPMNTRAASAGATSRVDDAVGLARMARARRLVTFHHDPAHDDDDARRRCSPGARDMRRRRARGSARTRRWNVRDLMRWV